MSKSYKQLKNKSISGVYRFLSRKYYQFLTIVSPRINTKARFRQKGRSLDLHNPKTLDEKIQCLKLSRYGKDPLIRQCADKYAVRKYIEEKGCSDLLVPLLAVYDKVDDVDWNALPNAFAMKWNFGCGFNIICSDKTKLDIEDAKKRMRKWGKDKSCYLDYAEMQYKGVPRKIIVEEYLKPETSVLPDDYKVYCFNGQPKYILVCIGREHGHPKFYFFDDTWNLARINKDSINAPSGFTYPKPICFEKLLQSARILATPFDFVRADFYVVNNKLYFGELTFTPSGGTDPNRLPETDLLFGNMLKI